MKIESIFIFLMIWTISGGSRVDFVRGGGRGEVIPKFPVKKPDIVRFQSEPSCSCGQKEFIKGHNFPPRRGSKVVGGFEAPYGSVPWQANIEQFNRFGNSTWDHICGAVLISRDHILTAGHCMLNIYSENIHHFRVVVGNHNLKKIDVGERIFKISSSNIIIHSQYGQCHSEHSNDIALIRIQDQWGQGVKCSDYIRPVCLPEIENSEFPSGTLCSISGFGRSKNYGDKEITNILQTTLIPIQKTKTCQKIYNPSLSHNIKTDNSNSKESNNNYNKDENNYIKNNLNNQNNRRFKKRSVRTGDGKCTPEHFAHREMICGGFLQNSQKMSGSCTGDSGGGLICKGKNGRYELTGLVSWFKGGVCGSGPTVFTKVSHYLKWIQEFKILIGP